MGRQHQAVAEDQSATSGGAREDSDFATIPADDGIPLHPIIAASAN